MPALVAWMGVTLDALGCRSGEATGEGLVEEG